jgi:uncharacterized protein DUF1367
MMQMLLMRTPAGLRGWTAEDQQTYDRFRRRLAHMENGECFKLEFSVPRNIEHHKKFFALVSLIAETSDVYDNRDKALTAIKIVAGHCDFVPHPESGELIPVPRSISFANMDQLEFDEFYENAVNGVLKHLLPAMTRLAFDEALDRVVRF